MYIHTHVHTIMVGSTPLAHEVRATLNGRTLPGSQQSSAAGHNFPWRGIPSCGLGWSPEVTRGDATDPVGDQMCRKTRVCIYIYICVYIYIIYIHYIHTLYTYIIYIHYIDTLYTYIIFIHYIHTLYTHIIYIHYIHILYTYICIYTHCICDSAVSHLNAISNGLFFFFT